MPRLKQGLVVAGLIIVLDQLSKYAVTQAFMLGDYVTLTPFFDLVRAHNTGAAFSLLADQAGWQRAFFISAALIASAILIHLLRRESGSVLFKLALSLILGGAIGNLIDRILHGYVVDFLSFHIQQHYWPAFNVADSAITIGALLLVWDSLKKPRKS
ncbi:lipoprotein signal peptidase [Sulfuriferula plumbiphila]|uniref:Lipoprotein signal peptidase n=1 Tax=Sulfuriferula plumbiphila TaxID=171865 RepID=A0A512L9P1_9PROT|nr:signal peptidase II [Sulfuriferula plumbiphila]BBP03694.1 lipoprotein signal peptidase [Sulfuriferula plumbiphila]GEP31204.1 lipoprotein signal peptidase [Sulfuriferula plumbiphila]